MLPQKVEEDSRAQAKAWLEMRNRKPTSWLGVVIVAALWLLAAYLAWSLFID